jgi:putative transposase
MPRKNLIRSNVLPYHVTARANNQEWFTLPMEQVWDLTLQSLKEAHSLHKVEIISFVLMSNHYHLLIRTPDANLDKFMYEFNKRLAFRLKDKTGNINHVLGSRYKWCLIQSQKYFMNCYRYIYQNPLRANITYKCEYYPYSSLHSQVFNKQFCVPLHDNIGFKDPHMLNWINEKIEMQEVEFIRKGLKQREFDTVLTRSSRRKKEI